MVGDAPRGIDEECRIVSTAEDEVDVDSESDEEPDVDLEPVDSKREDEPKVDPDASATGDRQDLTAGQRNDEAGQMQISSRMRSAT